MRATLRKKAQITIPSELISKLDLQEGDQFDIIEKDGTIVLLPLATYPTNYINELKSEVCEIREKIETGEKPEFDNVDALFKYLDK